jgi:hypothetical protein
MELRFTNAQTARLSWPSSKQSRPILTASFPSLVGPLCLVRDNGADVPRFSDSVVASGDVTDGSIRPLLSSLVNTAVTAVQALAGLTLPIIFVADATLETLVALAVTIVSVC